VWDTTKDDVRAYEIINYFYNTLPQHLKIEEWSYEPNPMKCFVLTFGRTTYRYDDKVLHQILHLKPDYTYHKNIDNLIEETPEFAHHRKVLGEREVLYHDYRNKMMLRRDPEFGYHKVDATTLEFREWVPNVISVELVLDGCTHVMKEEDTGIWVCRVVVEDTSDISDKSTTTTTTTIPYYLKIRNNIKTYRKMSPWTRRYLQHNAFTPDQSCEAVVDLSEPYRFIHPHVATTSGLRIYETHIGISQQRKGVGTYAEFTNITLPYIKRTGYDTIQIMGLLEHPHYSTFGYQPNFVFAPSSRFGTPNELKKLIDTAHGMGIKVILDVIVGHSCSNLEDGLNEFNGFENCFFKPKKHPLWGCCMFDHAKPMVSSYLVKCLIYWVEEFMVDGFRFDATTSMLFKDYGAHKSADELMKEFWTDAVNVPGIVFLRWINEVLHSTYPFMVTIAEDVCGFPGLCSPSGLGFDYQLAMHIPDIISKLIPVDYNHPPIFTYNEWDMHMIADSFLKPRAYINYTESHDQAFVGSCTIFNAVAGDLAIIPKYLRDQHYTTRHPKIRMAMQYSMIFRLLSCCMGNGTLTFTGNEFGHPLWIEFPSEDNELSFDKCHRKWDLLHNPNFIFKYLHEFEMMLNESSVEYSWLLNHNYETLVVDNKQQFLGFRKLDQYFYFNMHTENEVAYEQYVNAPGVFRVVLSTNQRRFGGTGCVLEKGTTFRTELIYSECMRNVRLTRQQDKDNEFNYDYKIRFVIPPLCCVVLGVC